jgi:hypothetical protein
MKIIVSSKSMYNCLKGIYFDNESVISVYLNRNELIFYTSKRSVSLLVESSEQMALYNQADRRWDWVCELLKSVGEQPIVMEITDKKLDVIFQY